MFQCLKASKATPLDPKPNESEARRLPVRLFISKSHIVGDPHYDGRSDTSKMKGTFYVMSSKKVYGTRTMPCVQ